MVSREQLLAWDPEVIIAADARFYDTLTRDSFWRRLSAVRNKRVYQMPSDPFGWIDEPPGSIAWSGCTGCRGCFIPTRRRTTCAARRAIFTTRCTAFKLTDAQIEHLVQRAGVAAERHVAVGWRAARRPQRRPSPIRAGRRWRRRRGSRRSFRWRRSPASASRGRRGLTPGLPQ